MKELVVGSATERGRREAVNADRVVCRDDGVFAVIDGVAGDAASAELVAQAMRSMPENLTGGACMLQLERIACTVNEQVVLAANGRKGACATLLHLRPQDGGMVFRAMWLGDVDLWLRIPDGQVRRVTKPHKTRGVVDCYFGKEDNDGFIGDVIAVVPPGSLFAICSDGATFKDEEHAAVLLDTYMSRGPQGAAEGIVDRLHGNDDATVIIVQVVAS